MSTIITLNSVQRCALIGILVDYALDNNSTQVWEAVPGGETTTIDELLTLLSADEPVGVIRGHTSQHS